MLPSILEKEKGTRLECSDFFVILERSGMEGDSDVQRQIFCGHAFHVFDHISKTRQVIDQSFGHLVNQIIVEFGTNDQVGEKAKPRDVIIYALVGPFRNDPLNVAGIELLHSFNFILGQSDQADFSGKGYVHDG